jgi:hypothetical protein
MTMTHTFLAVVWIVGPPFVVLSLIMFALDEVAKVADSGRKPGAR